MGSKQPAQQKDSGSKAPPQKGLTRTEAVPGAVEAGSLLELPRPGKELPDQPGARPLRQASVLRLQRQVGNGRVARIISGKSPVAQKNPPAFFIQRQPTGGAGGVDILSWPTVIPDSPPGTRVDVVPGAAGKDPTAKVSTPKGSQPEKSGESQTDEENEALMRIQLLCDQIKANRQGINERFMIRVQGEINKVSGTVGFEYTPDRESINASAEEADRAASSEYLKWLTTTDPTAVQDAGGRGNLNDRLKAQLELWDDIGSEGKPPAMNTWDGENVTWGRGFSGSGQVQTMMTDLFQRLPDLHAEFLRAGITVEGGQFLVVDVDRKFKYRDNNAEKFLRVDRKLVSLFANVSQDPRYRQAVLDANWRTFIGGTGNMPAAAVGWPRQARSVAGHNIHAGNFFWADFVPSGGSLPGVVQIIGRKFSKDVEGALVVSAAVTQKRLKNLARGFAMSALEGPIRFGLTYTGTEIENPPPLEEKPEDWKLQLEPGTMYFNAGTKYSFYILKS